MRRRSETTRAGVLDVCLLTWCVFFARTYQGGVAYAREVYRSVYYRSMLDGALPWDLVSFCAKLPLAHSVK